MKLERFNIDYLANRLHYIKQSNRLINSLVAKAKRGDKKAKDYLVLHYYRYIAKIAHWYIDRDFVRNMSLADLIDEGIIGLYSAFKKYSIKKKTNFATYATYWIKFTIFKAIGQKERLIPLPAYQNVLVRKFSKLKNRDKLTEEQIIKKMNLSREKYNELNKLVEEKIISLEIKNDG